MAPAHAYGWGSLGPTPGDCQTSLPQPNILQETELRVFTEAESEEGIFIGTALVDQHKIPPLQHLLLPTLDTIFQIFVTLLNLQYHILFSMFFQKGQMITGDFVQRAFEKNCCLGYRKYIQDISSMKMLELNLLAKDCRPPFLKVVII